MWQSKPINLSKWMLTRHWRHIKTFMCQKISVELCFDEGAVSFHLLVLNTAITRHNTETWWPFWLKACLYPGPITTFCRWHGSLSMKIMCKLLPDLKEVAPSWLASLVPYASYITHLCQRIDISSIGKIGLIVRFFAFKNSTQERINNCRFFSAGVFANGV